MCFLYPAGEGVYFPRRAVEKRAARVLPAATPAVGGAFLLQTRCEDGSQRGYGTGVWPRVTSQLLSCCVTLSLLCVGVLVQVRQLLHRWYHEAMPGGSSMWNDDRGMLSWVAKSGEYLNGCMVRLRREMVSDQVLRLGLSDPSAVVNGVLALMSKLPVDQRESVVAALRRGVLFADPLSSRQHVRFI
jgi:hypothetical protein